MELKVENFSIAYQNDSTASYLVIKAENNIPVINYQVIMLLNNKINGLLDFSMNYIEENLNCFYNVTSKCTLSGFISRKRFSRNEFLLTILSIINNLYHMKDFLLYENNILLDEKFIFVDPDSMSIYFAYLPFKNCENDVKTFFTRLIFNLIKFNEEISDNYIQRILEEMKKELFNLCSLKLLIENLLGEDIKNSDPGTCIANYADGRAGTASGEVFDKKPDIVAKGKIKIPKVINTAADSKAAYPKEIDPDRIFKKIRPAGSIKNSDNSGSQTHEVKISSGSVIIFILQIFLVMSYVLTLNSNIITKSDSPKITVLLLSFIFIAADILIIRLILEKKRKAGKLIKYEPLKFIALKMKGEGELKNKEYHDSTADKPSLNYQPLEENAYKGETMILKKKDTGNNPYLQEKEGGEKIIINSNSFMIGRIENFVNYVIDNSAVGKIHAEITNENGEFFVMDCNSRNGTFLNDIRLVSNTKNKIRYNDILRLANKEYIFLRPAVSEGGI